MIGTKLAAGIVRQENIWPQMPSELQDFVQGSECGERRTIKMRRAWNTDDGEPAFSVPAQISP